jgi:GPI-anchor transamidase subunit GAA1
MTGPTTFLKIGSFLPGAVLVSVAMMFAGLYEWVNAAWVPDDAPTEKTMLKLDTINAQEKPRWVKRRRPMLPALGILIATHVLGLALFSVITTSFFAKHRMVSAILNNI